MTKELFMDKLSSELAEILQRAASSIVLVQGKRYPASGVVWKKNLVVTADHTLPGSDEFEVRTSEGKSLGATLAGRDPYRDIAFLKIGEDLSPFEPTQKKQLRVGQLAVIAGRARGGRFLSMLTMISGSDSEYKNWRGSIFDKLDVSTRTEAVKAGITHGLISI